MNAQRVREEEKFKAPNVNKYIHVKRTECHIYKKCK